MRFTTCLIIVAGVLALAGFGLATLQAAEQGAAPAQDQWRYTFHNGEWWYWLPANRWVYWRDNRWNNYDPKASSDSHSSDVGATRADGSRAAGDSDVRPFYGHALSNLDQHPQEPSNEVGPFYGHALPNEVFGGRVRRGVRPFYGHAISAGD